MKNKQKVWNSVTWKKRRFLRMCAWVCVCMCVPCFHICLYHKNYWYDPSEMVIFFISKTFCAGGIGGWGSFQSVFVWWNWLPGWGEREFVWRWFCMMPAGTRPCRGTTGMLTEERGPGFAQWAAGATLRTALRVHVRCGVQWWVANSRQIQISMSSCSSNPSIRYGLWAQVSWAQCEMVIR